MDEITDTQVDDLLRQAEERLSQAVAPVPKADSQQQKNDSLDPPPKVNTKEKLSVRHPQISKAPTKDTAGNNWFDLPKTEMTAEMKRDWQILRMRNILDPKQQKKALRADPPKYSQVGEIVAGPTDFYSGRLTRKERKKNLLQEALIENDDAKLRTKYAGIQRNKMSGKKAHYQRVVAQRRKNKR